jgi:hypothetical protein
MQTNIFSPSRLIYQQKENPGQLTSQAEQLETIENAEFRKMAEIMQSVIKKPFALEVESPSKLVLTIEYKQYTQEKRKRSVVDFYCEQFEIMEKISAKEQRKLLEWKGLNPKIFPPKDMEINTGKFKMKISAYLTGGVLTPDDYSIKKFDSKNPLPVIKEVMKNAYEKMKKETAVEIKEYTHSKLDTFKLNFAEA